MNMHVLSTSYKGTDKEGRMRLGQQYSEKQWQVTEYENGCVLLVPMKPATDVDAMAAFDKVLTKHKKTMDALK
ncbi:MAG: hypothetical protein U1E78_02375 [Gammaproteobacteria bacterium]